MLGDISGAINIYIITGYTDMRKSIDGLCAIIMSELKEEPSSNFIFLFCDKRCDRIKALLREPDGYVLLYKRLDMVQGKYCWPRNSSEAKPIIWQQFDWLMSCPVCETQMVPIGTEIAHTELVFHPACLERVDCMVTTYEYPSCKDSLKPQFVKNEGTSPLIPHSFVSVGLAVHVMYGKFINALPYYRQEKDFENQFGVKIEHGTMAHRTIYYAQHYFSPIIDYFQRMFTKRKYVAGDDGLGPIIIYQYHLTRNSDATYTLNSEYLKFRNAV
ncbi:IS66 family insertion sequence element accessory protein TnpB [Faecalicatena contorta]|uniref:IS66 family insertion sequence element accessory protein TnpB n=1 Tax=Faecalicatena contorta TaxID=39482 RepID=UPI001F4125A8|nr:IS66 family insertion sequence element accessory protein TnpB [Faecalicatena contorta]MCF2680725.1 IS66 family insertion sequence element accessory protein TnpB [Faecalicatena contorta]